MSSFLYQRSVQSGHYFNKMGFSDFSESKFKISKLVGTREFFGGKSKLLDLISVLGLVILSLRPSEKSSTEYLVPYHSSV